MIETVASVWAGHDHEILWNGRASNMQEGLEDSPVSVFWERDAIRFKVEVMDELWESSNTFSF